MSGAGFTAILFAVVFTFSCVPKRKMVYLQPEEGQNADSLYQYQRTSYRLQKGDILSIDVVSLEEEANEIFTASKGRQVNQNIQNGGDLYYMSGYSINDSGFVSIPIVGGVKVEGLTLEEAKQRIDELLKKFFSLYFLNVKLGGLRFTALGEFKAPGKYVILQNQATIFEAIAMAGDLEMVASRSDVKLIRQYPGGTKIHEVNLLDQSIIQSPFYFIQPNDVIYVEPLPAKSWGIGVSGAQTATLVISIVTSALLLYTTIVTLNR